MAEMLSFTWESAREANSNGFWQLFSASNEHGLTQHERLQHRTRKTYRLFQNLSRFYIPEENGEHERYEQTSQGNRREQWLV
jgi:hypothetical protein